MQNTKILTVCCKNLVLCDSTDFFDNPIFFLHCPLSENHLLGCLNYPSVSSSIKMFCSIFTQYKILVLKLPAIMLYMFTLFT